MLGVHWFIGLSYSSGIQLAKWDTFAGHECGILFETGHKKISLFIGSVQKKYLSHNICHYVSGQFYYYIETVINTFNA